MANHQVAADSIRATGLRRAGKRGWEPAATRDEMAVPVRDRIRRLYVPEATYFVTAVTRERQPFLAHEGAIGLLRETMRAVQAIHPFGVRAFVFLPDHLHLLLYVPAEATISEVMHSVKRNFTRNYKDRFAIAGSLSLWQRRFWDHVIRNERDFSNYLDYIHWNPVKHGYVTRPVNYQDSSFHEYVKRGWYDAEWGALEPETLKGISLE